MSLAFYIHIGTHHWRRAYLTILHSNTWGQTDWRIHHNRQNSTTISWQRRSPQCISHLWSQQDPSTVISNVNTRSDEHTYIAALLVLHVNTACRIWCLGIIQRYRSSFLCGFFYQHSKPITYTLQLSVLLPNSGRAFSHTWLPSGCGACGGQNWT